MNKKQFDIAIGTGGVLLIGAALYLSALTTDNSVVVDTVVKDHIHYKPILRDDTVGSVVVAPEQFNIVTREGVICEVNEHEYGSMRIGDSVRVTVEEVRYSSIPSCLGVE